MQERMLVMKRPIVVRREGDDDLRLGLSLWLLRVSNAIVAIGCGVENLDARDCGCETNVIE